MMRNWKENLTSGILSYLLQVMDVSQGNWS